MYFVNNYQKSTEFLIDITEKVCLYIGVQQFCTQDIELEGGKKVKVQSRISAYLKRMGISQASVCEKTGIRPDSMSAMLNGKRKMTADEFEKICFAIEKSPNDFISAKQEVSE